MKYEVTNLVEAEKRLKELQKADYFGSAHLEADKILCNFIHTLGYTSLADEFNKVPRWYD